MPGFDYRIAFSRNLGWTTEWEQAALRNKCVAIAGLGGVGGAHLLALSRLGVGRFHVADFDRFDLVNMNRQAGATMASLGCPKVDVLAEMALSINPELQLSRFGEGVTPDNLDRFLLGCDLFVDGLDFFALNIRARTFARCAELGIPAVTAAPIGMGSGYLAFLPGGMTFEQYFRLDGHLPPEQHLRFLLGMAPAGLHRNYLVDETRVDLRGHRGPSTAAGCELCAGIVGTLALQLLLGRGGVQPAPVHLHFDAYRGVLVRTRLRWGNAGPVQQLKLALGRRWYRTMEDRSSGFASPENPALPGENSPMLEIFDLARWAPSGDNSQPWRFELVDAQTVIIHLAGDAQPNLYEYRDGEPVLLAGGMLLESIRVAASLYGRAPRWTVEADGPPWRARVSLPVEKTIQPSSLAAALPMRSVKRGALGMRALTAPEKTALQDALGTGLTVSWHEGPRDRVALARLGAMATGIRLRAPEAFAIHQRVVDWQQHRSPDRMPAQALGLSGATLAMMRWAMQRWNRADRLNAIFGTGGIALELDLWPGLASAAFFVIRNERSADASVTTGTARAAALLETGEHLQRFWLTATQLGLAVQPTMASLIFAHYGAESVRFTSDEKALARAKLLAERAEALLGPLRPVRFIGRIGRQRDGIPGPRSVRKPLQSLLLHPLGPENPTLP